METNLYSCTSTGRTISEKTMEDGNLANARDENISSTSIGNLYGERPAKFTSNGHDFGGESSSPPSDIFEQRRPNADAATDDKSRKRINPLRIHLGKQPFVDNSLQYYNPLKRKKPSIHKTSDLSATTTAPRAPKLIPKRNKYQNVTPHVDSSTVDNEQDKPVPRLVPKSQLLQYNKKGKVHKGPQLKDYAQSLGLQPMVKFKCRKCCSMSFKTLAMLKEHQLVCRAQAREPALSPEATPKQVSNDSTNSGPSRVTRKVYLCSACGTYYENWNLFLHMREVHNRHICLFCLGMFSKAEKLSTHLTNKHNVKEFNYDSKEEFLNVYNGTLYLMCCACDEICSEQDDFFNHDCNNIKPKPVPLLVSKNAIKPNSVKNTVTSNEIPINGSTSLSKSISEKKESKEARVETVMSKPEPIPKPFDPTPSSARLDAANTTAIGNEVRNSADSEMEPDTSVDKKTPSLANCNASNAEPIKNLLPNGDDSHSEESDSPVSDDTHTPVNKILQPKSPETSCQPLDRECGIKLKLSLNKANSPVIINSTVDPTVGQHVKSKPPQRNRRPPKRYEKDKFSESAVQPKTPSIKMTICDRADSPFVKTTIYENNKETTVKTILNNNLDITTQSPDNRPDNTIKTTIYDNKPEHDENTLNRVPKLTVRVPKELLDKDSSSDYSSDSDGSEKLTVDEYNTTTAEDPTEPKLEPQTEEPPMELMTEDTIAETAPADEILPPSNDEVESEIESKTEPPEPDSIMEPKVEEPSIAVTELSLDKPLDKYPLKDLLKVFLSSTVFNCIYCNHVRKIAVNCEQLSLHMVAEHRFSATVDSITAEELLPETITAKLQSGAADLKTVYINLDSYDSDEKCENVSYEHVFECFHCYFKTPVHKDLCLHNRKMHQKTILLCVMCKSNFYSYSELLCHLCPGTYDSEYEVKFRCCFCNVDSIPSQFRLMVHLRKIHHTCDVCLEFCHNQARLSNHVWKHKLHHLCFRCGIAYRNKLDITNHLFWKHGTESILCKKCMQKKWPHVYHFCTPPAIFACDECNLQFSRPVCLKVHKRFHSEEFPHICTEEDCTEKFVSKKLLSKHVDEHRKKLVTEVLSDAKPVPIEPESEAPKEIVPVIDLVDDKPSEEAGTSEVKKEADQQEPTKKLKKKKIKDKDALLLDVNLPALNLSESDSSDESDSGIPPPCKVEKQEDTLKEEPEDLPESEEVKISITESSEAPIEEKVEDKPEQMEDEKPSEQQVLDIWDNFKKYQAKTEKQKTPPLVPIRKHVCESDHDYCLVPIDMNGDEDSFNLDKKKSKKTPKKHRAGGGLSSSSSSSSDSDSSCSCGSNCSCSSSSGSSSSSSSDSDSSDGSGNEKKKTKRSKKSLPNRRLSNGSNVDVMGVSETPILIPEKVEPPIAESDLETAESETDEEFYDENPQQIANKLHEEKRNQLMLLATVAPSEGGGSISRETSRPATPIQVDDGKEGDVKTEPVVDKNREEKPTSSKKKSKKKKKSKSSKKHAPIKINIPKDVIAKSEIEALQPLPPNKITISLQSNTVQLPDTPKPTFLVPTASSTTAATSAESKRASKRRRVPNKFYGYTSDEEQAAQQQTPTIMAALKPQQPPKLEWRKEDLPSPVTSRVKKEIPSMVLTNRMYNYTDPIRLTAPIPDPEPPRILMNSESVESSDSDSSEEGNLEIYQPSQPPIPPPQYLNSGTSSLPYAFQRPPVREAREGESVYCYCRCPYDEVSEMIACDAEGCPIEWFHFECVGIMVPPKGKWYCPECRKNQNYPGYR